MTTYATPADVRALWMGSDQLPDDTIIQAWLDEAEQMIFVEIPSVADRLTDDPDGEWARRVTFVEKQLVLNVMRNPDGIRQRSQTAGSYTDSTTYGSETITQVLDLTPAHRAILTGGGKRHVGIDMTETATPHPLDHAWVNGPDWYAPGT